MSQKAENSIIPQEIKSYLEYIGYQDALWSAYANARETVCDPGSQEILSYIYDKLMRHLEAAYYKKLCGRGLLSESEILALKQKLLLAKEAHHDGEMGFIDDGGFGRSLLSINIE